MDGLTAVVTGADGDLGEAVARRFAAAGARVVAGAEDRDELDELVADFEARNSEEEGDVTPVRADVRDEYDVERLLELAARESDGGVDVVVACAEVDHAGPDGTPLADESYAAFDDTLRTNARGVFATVREAVPHLADDARVLVPVASGPESAAADSGPSDPDSDDSNRDDPDSDDPEPGRGSYAVSKAAAVALARQFATELDSTVGAVDLGAPDDSGNDAEDADPETAADLLTWAATEASPEQVDGEIVGLSAFESATA